MQWQIYNIYIQWWYAMTVMIICKDVAICPGNGRHRCMMIYAYDYYNNILHIFLIRKIHARGKCFLINGFGQLLNWKTISSTWNVRYIRAPSTADHSNQGNVSNSERGPRYIKCGDGISWCIPLPLSCARPIRTLHYRQPFPRVLEWEVGLSNCSRFTRLWYALLSLTN